MLPNDRPRTHSECGQVPGCMTCHCHHCHLQAIRERDLAEEALTRVETELLATIKERDEARECAREYLPCVKYQYDSWQQGARYEQEQRNRHAWLGPMEEEVECSLSH
jgi:hypothetical protein